MKRAKRLIALILCLLLTLTATACGSNTSSTAATATAATAATAAPAASGEADASPASGDTAAATTNPNARVLKWSANSPEGYPDYESAMRIKAYVEEKTNGEIILEVYPDNILGDWTVVFDEIMNGGIDFTATSVPDYYDPRIAACTLPYLTATYDEVSAVFRKGGYYDQVLQECYSDLNVKYFGIYCDGYCGIGVRGEVQNAAIPGADKGSAIIRVPPNQGMILAVENLGFKYSSIPYSDTYTSLQTGVVQGWCGGPISQHYGQWLDVEDHYYDYDIWQESRHYIASMDTWNSLTEEQQQIFTEIIEQEAALSIKNAQENDAKYKDLYEAKEGYTLVRFTDEEKKAFADDCREKVWPQLNDLYGEEFLTELLADIQANT